MATHLAVLLVLHKVVVMVELSAVKLVALKAAHWEKHKVG